MVIATLSRDTHPPQEDFPLSLPPPKPDRVYCVPHHGWRHNGPNQKHTTNGVLKNTLYVYNAETYGIWTIPTTVSQRPSPRPGRTGPGGHFLAKKGQKMPKKGGKRTGESFCSGLIKGFLPENGYFWAIFRGPDPHFRAYPGWGVPPPLFRECMGVNSGSSGIPRPLRVLGRS